MFSEHAHLEWLRRRAAADERLRVPLGDDAAVAADGVRQEVLAVDAVVEGVHAESGPGLPERLARKAVRANVSDVAAMGARPQLALLTLIMPEGAGDDVARRVHETAAVECGRHGAVLCGGDTVRGGDRLIVSVTLTGRLFAAPVTRGGARPGDLVLVTGPLGGSIRGRHADLEPRLAEAEALVRLGPPTAMTDVSDGLLRDLANVAAASSCGAVVRAGAVPVHDDARALAATTGRDALEHALYDGEDFELLFCAPPDVWTRIESGWKMPVIPRVIGEMVTEGLWIEDLGERRRVEPGGFDHGPGS